MEIITNYFQLHFVDLSETNHHYVLCSFTVFITTAVRCCKQILNSIETNIRAIDNLNSEAISMTT